jgi:hypothetical protein
MTRNSYMDTISCNWLTNNPLHARSLKLSIRVRGTKGWEAEAEAASLYTAHPTTLIKRLCVDGRNGLLYRGGTGALILAVYWATVCSIVRGVICRA